MPDDGGASGDDGAGPACPSLPHSAADPLLRWISTDTELGRTVRREIMDKGYVLLRGVISPDECDREVDRLWAWVEAVAPGVSRADPATWYPAAPGGPDPWPHSGWVSLPDMMQNFQAGWLFSDLRERLAARVFEPLYGTRELHCSREGFTFHRPTLPAGRHPLVGKQGGFVCGRPSHTRGEHFDQRVADEGLHCIQSSTALIDQGPEDGCFRCWPGSHRHHVSLMCGKYRGAKDWVPLTDDELGELASLGMAPTPVPVRRGDVILWRSDLAHSGQAPGATASFRAVTYSCMLPAALTPPEAMPAKLDGYLGTHPGDHRPNVETGDHFSPPKRGEGQAPRGEYFRSGPPELTWRQAELYGLVPYGLNGEEELERARADAAVRGVRFVSGSR